MEFKASHILVKEKSLAEKIAKEAQNGSSFATLARKYSQCPSRSKGGDLGWFESGQMVPTFERAVKKLSNGRISDPVRTQFGYHVIKKTGVRD
jgi:peptidyl-prolyl cis-trans isomerase C